MIRFTRETTATVVINFDEETEKVDDMVETFKEGEEFDADIVDENEKHNTYNIQFGDGSMIYNLPKDCVVVY